MESNARRSLTFGLQRFDWSFLARGRSSTVLPLESFQLISQAPRFSACGWQARCDSATRDHPGAFGALPFADANNPGGIPGSQKKKGRGYRLRRQGSPFFHKRAWDSESCAPLKTQAGRGF
jgi:hypothetical protein